MAEMIVAKNSAQEPLLVIGLGALGFPIACNILKGGYPVIGCDRRADVLRGFAEAGGDVATSFDQIPDRLHTAVLLVANEAQIDQVLWGASGIIAQAPQVTNFVMVTTVSPDFVEETARRLAEQGRRLIEAPVSGGVRRAIAGTLTTILSGDTTPEDFALIRTYSPEIFHSGGKLGSASAVKLLNQMLCASNVIATVEVARVTKNLGLDPEVIHKFICASSGVSQIFLDRYPKIFSDVDEVGSTIDIYAKDTALAMHLVGKTEEDAPLLHLVHERFQSYRNAGLGAMQDYRMANFDNQHVGASHENGLDPVEVVKS